MDEDRCYITGWGTLRSDGETPAIHQEGMVIIISSATTWSAHRAVRTQTLSMHAKETAAALWCARLTGRMLCKEQHLGASVAQTRINQVFGHVYTTSWIGSRSR